MGTRLAAPSGLGGTSSSSLLLQQQKGIQMYSYSFPAWQTTLGALCARIEKFQNRLEAPLSRHAAISEARTDKYAVSAKYAVNNGY